MQSETNKKGFPLHWMPNCSWSNKINYRNQVNRKCSVRELIDEGKNCYVCRNCIKCIIDRVNSLYKICKYNEEIVVSPAIVAEFYNAGHIPGSASVLLTVKKQNS